MSYKQLIKPNVNSNTLFVYFGTIGVGKPLADWYGDCLAVARNAFGIKTPKGKNAWDCYEHYNKYNHANRSFPKGVYFLVWFSGYGGQGHVAIAYIDPKTGKMTIYTSPWTHKPAFDTYTSVDALAKGYGVTYVAWSEDLAGTRVIQPIPPKPAPKPSIKTGVRVARKGTAKILVPTLNVRSDASTGSKVVSTYKKGQTFTYDSYIITNGYVWLSYVSYGGARHYVAEGPYDNNPKNVYVSGGIS